MGKNKPIQHRLTEFIEVLKEKSNDYNKFAICLACKEAKSHKYTYSNKFVNTKRLVKVHLKNCTYFKNKKSEREVEKVQELNELKRLYESTSTTFLLDRSADDTDDEDSYAEFEDANWKAKWPLNILFLPDLEAPFFANS
ncbi:8728_t:CDS:2 [Gigaspora rosea]|nr:8728_t:CDS:2 [Gigaspora rosea]